MAGDTLLYGYDPSSYVFAVRILLFEKGVDCERVPLDVIAGEPQSASHRRLHPFGKVPVFVHDGLRVLETGAILRYVDDAFAGPGFVPANAVDRARLDMATGLYDAYGYAPMARVVGSHRFPSFVGHPTRTALNGDLERLDVLFGELMRIRGDSAFLAGDRPSLADCLVAPACFYLDLVEEGGVLRRQPGFDDWWARVQTLYGYRAAIPDLSEWGERAPGA